jgi:hypothetical protein
MMLWFAAFIATCAIELAIVYGLTRLRPRVILLAQAVTHPLVWLAMAYVPGDEQIKLYVVELAATIVEAFMYRRRIDNAFAVSALANGASLLIVALVAA